MLDQVWIFRRNGIVLFSKQLAAIKGSFLGGSIVNHLIQAVLLDQKTGLGQATLEKHVLKWTVANEADLLIVLVYNKTVFSSITYVDELLQKLKEDFLSTFSKEDLDGHSTLDYDKRFTKILSDVESRARIRRNSSRSLPTTVKQTSLPETASSDARDAAVNDDNIAVDDDRDDEGNDGDAGASDQEDGGEQGDADGDAARAARLALLKKAGSRGPGGRRRRSSGESSVDSEVRTVGDDQQEGGKKGPKKPTTWHDGTGKMTKKQMEKLDRSKRTSGSLDDDDSAIIRETRATFMPVDGEAPEWEQEDSVDIIENEETASSGQTSKPSFLSKFFSQITGNATLEEADLDPVLEEMKNMLIGKNVAAEIANQICDSVRTTLVGQKLPSLTRVKTLVREALEKAIVRVLTPKRSTDILREIMAAKAEGRPYSVVFVGINGVGKSTSLSKVCYYLKSHGLKVMIAACDTFRSGAVEQLKVHARCLEVDLFDKGYHKDPAAVAKDAIKEATEAGYDVVLIDTAGRMQNKEPLMRALAKLVSDNSPDLVLFVGEALVGNDGIDQLSMFDQALANYSPPGTQHQIDGIILTKFDTVDEKVGAALSMSYKTGQPILFVGTGQKYTHLKKLNVGFVINCLFR